MPDALEGFHAKIRRAKAHLETIETEIRRVIDVNTGAIVHETKDGARGHVFTIQRVEQPASDLSAVIGDLVHNARSALDHLAFQLVVASNGAPDRKTAFPIFNER